MGARALPVRAEYDKEGEFEREAQELRIRFVGKADLKYEQSG